MRPKAAVNRIILSQTEHRIAISNGPRKEQALSPLARGGAHIYATPSGLLRHVPDRRRRSREASGYWEERTVTVRYQSDRIVAVNGIKPGMTLHDAGYIFFKNDTFALSDNFWIGPKGITFYYNPYEIAPYSMGTTELLLTYWEIRDLIEPGGLLGPMK